MLFFWLTILSIVLVLSFLLATRSMKSNQAKIKPAALPQALFLIRNPEQINGLLLEKLHQTQAVISFERLFKGGEGALAVYGPDSLPQTFPQLNLLELEDYLIPKEETFTQKDAMKINADQSFGWQISIEPGMGKPDLANLNLEEDEQFFYQIILVPITQKEENFFQVTTRVMVATKNKMDKVPLAKKIFTKVNESLGIASNDLQSSPQFFEKYEFRLPAGEKLFTLAEALKIIV